MQPPTHTESTEFGACRRREHTREGSGVMELCGGVETLESARGLAPSRTLARTRRPAGWRGPRTALRKPFRMKAAWLVFIGLLGMLGPVHADSWTSNPSLGDIVQDTHVFSVSPNNSYPTQAAVGVGYSSTAGGHLRGLIQFRMPSNLAGSTVTSATLELRGTNSPASFTTNVRVARITSSWSDSSTTWNNQPSFASSDASVASLSPPNALQRTYSWDVTAMVQAWASGTSNYGFMVKRDTESTTNAYFAFNSLEYTGAEAKHTLRITYTPPPALPAPVISVNTSTSSTDLTDTSAVVRWTWSGSTSNSTSISIAVRDLLTNQIIVSQSGISDTTTSYTLTGLNPSNQYRINVSYQPVSGYSEGSAYIEFYTRFAAPLLLFPDEGTYDGPPAQFGWQPDSGLWTMAHAIQISTSSSFSARTGFSSTVVNTTTSTAAYSWSGGTNGQTYWWSVRQYSSNGTGPPTSYYSTPQSFVYGAEPNNLGIDIENLNGKLLGGLIHIPGVTTSAPGGQIWKTFFIRLDGVNIAKAAGDFPTFTVDTGFLIWRDMSGQPVMNWTDILDVGSGPYRLKVVGLGANGTEVESGSFIVNLQPAGNRLNLTLSASDIFPRYKSSSTPAATTFSASTSGGSGTVTLSWGSSSGSMGSGSSVSAVMNTPGLNVVRCVAKDTSGKRTVEGISVPIAVRDRCGSASGEDGGAFAVQSTDVTSGNLHLDFTDLMVPAIGVPFTLARSYNTAPATIYSPTLPSTGKWAFALEEYIEHSHINSFALPGSEWPIVYFHRADGSIVQFYPGLDGLYHPMTPGMHDMLEEDFDAGTFTLYTADTPPLVKTFQVQDPNTRANATYRLRSVKTLRDHGLTVNYTNSTGRQISTVTDQSGRAYSFYYQDGDAPARISRVADFSGRNIYYDWDGNGNLRTVTDARGYTTTFNYHTSGNGNRRLQSIRLPRLNYPLSNIDYDAAGRVTAVQMPLGSTGGGTVSSTTSFGYQTAYVDVTRPGTGNNLRVGLDASRNATYVTESYGVANRTTTLTRLGTADVSGAAYRMSDLGLTSQTAPPPTAAAATSITYAPNGRGLVTQTTNGSGTTQVSYPPDVLNAAPGALTKNLAPPSAITDARGKTFSPQFTGAGEITAFLNPYNQGGSITAFYSANGLPRYMDDGRGNITEFQYSSTGDITLIRVPSDPDNANRDVVITYPAGNANRGLPATITDRKGYQTSMEWDAAGNPTLIRAVSLSPGSGETRDIVITYDENGNRSSVTDRRGKTTNLDYDDMDRTWRVRQPSPDGVAARPTATTDFDTLGRPTLTTSPNGNTSEQIYGTSGNGAGRLQSVRAYKSGGGYDTLQSITYLSDGRTESVTDGEGITRSYVYKSSPRQHLVHRITEPMPGGFITYQEYDYDANDQVTRQTTGTTDGSVTTPLPSTLYQYDDAGRLQAVINVMNGNWGNPNDAAHIRTGVTYYEDDQIDTITDPRQQAIKHLYDPLGRLSLRRDALNNEWTWRYDANGNLRYEGFPGNGSYPARTITRTWGVLDRLDSIDYGDGVTPTVSFGYDANGNRTSMSDRWGSASYVYDALNRPTSITRNLSGLSSQTLGYAYFPGGQLKTLTYPGSRAVNYSYDHLDRMSTVTPWAGGAFSYTWRRNGQIDLLTNPNGTQTDYQYLPSNGRLSRLLTTRGGTTIADQVFTYDPVGNITRIQGDLPLAPPADAAIGMTPDNANRLATINGQAVTNDPAGRSRTLPGPLNATTTWEGMDWLSNHVSGGVTTSHTYDGDGVRLSRARTGSTTTRYLIDPTAALPNVVAENDNGNNPQRFYIHGAGGLLASVDTSNNVSTYHFSHRGDTLALTNASGSITESYGYSPYGVTAASNAGSWNPFRFTGQHGVMDEGNGLSFMRARFYAASVGRFLSMDQLAGDVAEAQTLNRFGFVTGSPLSKIDPSGTVTIDAVIEDGLDVALAALESRHLAVVTVSAKSLKYKSVQRVVGYYGGTADWLGDQIYNWIAAPLLGRKRMPIGSFTEYRKSVERDLQISGPAIEESWDAIMLAISVQNIYKNVRSIRSIQSKLSWYTPKRASLYAKAYGKLQQQLAALSGQLYRNLETLPIEVMQGIFDPK